MLFSYICSELQEQKYLSQTLIRCKQFRLGIYHAFGEHHVTITFW